MNPTQQHVAQTIVTACRAHGLTGIEAIAAADDAAYAIVAHLNAAQPRSQRDALRVALINPDHIQPYHYNANFHYGIDTLVGLLPLWIKAMADAAADQDAMLADMTQQARWSDPVTIEVGDITFADLQNLLRPEPTSDPSPKEEHQ